MNKPRLSRRGIYLIPTIFTVGNLFCGFSSMIQASIGQLELAAVLIVVAGFADGLDGRLARLTGSTSRFGLEFDSLADLVSFGLAPSMLAWHWALRPAGRIGWLLAFVWVVFAAMRLARFNTQSSSAADRRHFVGLPSPAAGGIVACVVMAFPRVPSDARVLGAVIAGGFFAVGLLMVSRLRYRSFREFDLGNRRSHFVILPVVAILVAIVLQPKGVLLVLGSLYVLSTPAMFFWRLVRNGKIPRVTEAGGEPRVADEPTGR